MLFLSNLNGKYEEFFKSKIPKSCSESIKEDLNSYYIAKWKTIELAKLQ